MRATNRRRSSTTLITRRIFCHRVRGASRTAADAVWGRSAWAGLPLANIVHALHTSWANALRAMLSESSRKTEVSRDDETAVTESPRPNELQGLEICRKRRAWTTQG